MKAAVEDLRNTAIRLDQHDLLRKSTSELLGVSQEMAAVLKKVGIESIFDLGTANLFASARAVVDAGRLGSPSSTYGLVSRDLLVSGVAENPLDTTTDLTINNLRMLTPDVAQELMELLDVQTIRELASWPPYRAARRIVGETMGSSAEPEDEQSEELRPRMGEYPTERVYYSTLVMLHMNGQAGNDALESAISLDPLVANPLGFNRPAIGALLTFSQSWYSQGVTLGHMLHSLALAPGEATRIAVIDWSRRTRASATENITESEQLANATQHNRAVSEVQSAVAADFQAGGSRSTSDATSTSHSEQSAATGGMPLIFDASTSTTDQTATTHATAESSGWSLGNRSVLGTMTQNVNDRTEQHATSVRNRRASAVREVSQSEHEEVSSRIVANYNHMHALTVQYYEVVQIYRTVSQLHRADRVLFIPLELLDFNPGNIDAGMRVVDRFRGPLMRAALNRRVQSLIWDDTTAVEIRPASPIRVAAIRPDVRATRMISFRPAMISIATGAAAATPTATPAAPPPTMRTMRVWDESTLALASRMVNRPLIRPNSDSLHVPDDTELVAVSFDSISVRNVRMDRIGAGPADNDNLAVPTDTGRVELPRGIPFNQLEAIHAAKSDEAPAEGAVTLHCSYMGRRFSLPAFPIQLGQGTASQQVVVFNSDQADRRRELLQHLQDNRHYYSRGVFASLDSAALTMVLSRFVWNGKPLIDQVEPKPISVAGNYLVMRAPISGDEPSGVKNGESMMTWTDLLSQRGVVNAEGKPGNSDERLIPIPTAGVFAEAVLGRSNSAEKLDITRFWNWQDSPIPLQPAEIAPIATGTRGEQEDLKPGQLSPPVLNIMNPTTLPEPAGLGAALAALQNLNFRDMSGLAGTQGLVKAGMEGTLDAATEAGQLASENMKVIAQKAIAMGQIAADLIKSFMGMGGGGAGGGGGSPKVEGISAGGALINKGAKIDKEISGAGNGPSSSATSPAESNNGSGPQADSAVPSNGNRQAEYSRERAYTDRVAFGSSPDALRAVNSRFTDAATSPSTSSTTARRSRPVRPGPSSVTMTVTFKDINDTPTETEYSWAIFDNSLQDIPAPISHKTSEYGIGVGVGKENFGRLTSGTVQFRALYDGFPVELITDGEYTVPADSSNLRLVVRQVPQKLNVVVENGQTLGQVLKDQFSGKIGGEGGFGFIKRLNLELNGSRGTEDKFEAVQNSRIAFEVLVPSKRLEARQINN
jgi:hypothetical protein